MHRRKRSTAVNPTRAEEILRELACQKSGTIYQKAWSDFSACRASLKTSASDVRARQDIGATHKPSNTEPSLAFAWTVLFISCPFIPLLFLLIWLSVLAILHQIAQCSVIFGTHCTVERGIWIILSVAIDRLRPFIVCQFVSLIWFLDRFLVWLNNLMWT